MEHLTGWRMLLAGERLKHSSDPVSAIALSLGYEAKNAFQHGVQKSNRVFATATWSRPLSGFAPRNAEIAIMA